MSDINEIKSHFENGHGILPDKTIQYGMQLLTTIESQKEEIEKWRKEAFANHPTQWAYDQACAALNKKTIEIESLKAITELAVKGLKYYADETFYEFYGMGTMALEDKGAAARSILVEIERLSQ